MARDYTKATSILDATENAYSDLDIFFTKHPVTNDITAKKGADAIKRAVRNILLTNQYERPFKPGFGSNLRKLLFELNAKEVGNRIVNEIRRKLSVLEPRINNIQIRVDGEPDTSELDITVFYNITNGLQNQGVNFTVSRVR